jgi:hypothetical protein
MKTSIEGMASAERGGAGVSDAGDPARGLVIALSVSTVRKGPGLEITL